MQEVPDSRVPSLSYFWLCPTAGRRASFSREASLLTESIWASAQCLIAASPLLALISLKLAILVRRAFLKVSNNVPTNGSLDGFALLHTLALCS